MNENPFKDRNTVTGTIYGDFEEIDKMHKEDLQREIDEDYELALTLSPEEKEARDMSKEIRSKIRTIRAHNFEKMTDAQKSKQSDLDLKFVAHRPHILKTQGELASDHYQKLLQEYKELEDELTV